MAFAFADILKKPTQSNHSRNCVQTQVGAAHAGAGYVEIIARRARGFCLEL